MTDGLHSFGMAFEHKKNRGDLKKEKVTVKSFSPVWLLVTPWTVAHQAPPSVGSPGKNTGVGCHFLLQGIFPTLASNPGLLHYKQMLYPLSHQGSLLDTLPCVISSLHRRSLSLALWAILQKKKLKLREAKSHVKEHTASTAGSIVQLLSLQT